LKAIASSPLVHEGTRILLHRPREDHYNETFENLTLVQSKVYGRSVVDFFDYFEKK
jgi:16S rRNA G966 N2-methylase RsmD